jgi:F0F1-type ATP synthase assembly protein I
MAARAAHRKRADPEAAGAASLHIGRWLRIQSLVAVALAAVLLAAGPIAAYSSLFGSLAAFLPALLFTAFVGREIGSDSAAFLRAAVVGEAVKLLLVAAICTAVFVWVEPLSAGWFFAGMIAVMVAGWIGLITGLKSGE